MPLTPGDIDAQRQYAEDAGADLDSLKTFTKEHIDYLRYRGTPLEEEKKKLAEERESLEQRSLNNITNKSKNTRSTPSIRAPIPSIPVKGMNTLEENPPSITDKKLDDVVVAVNKIAQKTEQPPAEMVEASELIEPVAEVNMAEESPATTSVVKEDTTESLPSVLQTFDNTPISTPESLPRSDISTQLPLPPVATSPIPTSQLTDLDNKQPAEIPSLVTQTNNLITNNNNTSAPSPATIPTPVVPQQRTEGEEAQNIKAVLDASISRPPEFGEKRDIDNTNLPSLTQALQNVSPEISSKVADSQITGKIKEDKEPGVDKEIISKDNIIAQEKAAAAKIEKEDIRDSIIQEEREAANKSIENQEEKVMVQNKEKDIEEDIINEERKIANEDIINEERENAAAVSREKEVVENANIENISNQIKSVRELFGSFATKKPEANGLDIKAAVTLIRPIADTLVSINTSLISILNRISDPTTAGNTMGPVLNNPMGGPANTTTINSGMIDSTRDSFRAHSSVAFSSGPRSSTPGFMV